VPRRERVHDAAEVGRGLVVCDTFAHATERDERTVAPIVALLG
jgi:hypothetical protein